MATKTQQGFHLAFSTDSAVVTICPVFSPLSFLGVHAGTVWADTGSRVPTRNDPRLVSSTTKTLLSGGPWPGPRELTTLPTHTHTYTRNVPQYHQAQHAPPWSRTLKLSLSSCLSLHLCLSQPLWGVCLSAERGDCSIAEKMYKMLSPLSSVEPFPSTVETGNCTESPFCSPLKMSTWIWSSCIANNYKCGPGAEACTHTQSDAHIYSETGKALPTVLNQCWGFTVHD